MRFAAAWAAIPTGLITVVPAAAEPAPASGLTHRGRAMLRLERYRMQPFPNELDDMPDRAA
jgi:hypothetical protein